MADGVAAPLAAVSLLRRPLALVPCLICLPAMQRAESSRAASVQRQHISTAAQLESRQQDRCAAQSTHRFPMMTGVQKENSSLNFLPKLDSLCRQLLASFPEAAARASRPGRN